MIYSIIPGYNIFKYIVQNHTYRGKAKIGYKVSLSGSIYFEGDNEIRAFSHFKGTIGYGSYISQNCDIEGEIGRFCSIAPYVKVISGVHPYKKPFATTSPFFYSLRKDTGGKTFATEQLFEENNYVQHNKKVIIGSDCWIGYGAKLVAGIKVGNGAVILSEAVVTRDIPPYAIVGGIPAKILSYRYDDITISKLLRIRWWDESIEWLRNNWKLLTDVDVLTKTLLDEKNLNI